MQAGLLREQDLLRDFKGSINRLQRTRWRKLIPSYNSKCYIRRVACDSSAEPGSCGLKFLLFNASVGAHSPPALAVICTSLI